MTEEMKAKIKFQLVGGTLLFLWILSFALEQMWLSGVVAIAMGSLLVLFRDHVTEIAVSNTGRLAKDVPVAIEFQKKIFRLVLPVMGVVSILFGLLVLIGIR